MSAAEVVVSSARGGSSERRRTVSDAAGRFLVTVADSGPFVVAARHAGSRSQTWQRFDHPPAELRVPLVSETALALTVLGRGGVEPLPGASVEVGVRGSMDASQGDQWTTTASGRSRPTFDPTRGHESGSALFVTSRESHPESVPITGASTVVASQEWDDRTGQMYSHISICALVFD